MADIICSNAIHDRAMSLALNIELCYHVSGTAKHANRGSPGTKAVNLPLAASGALDRARGAQSLSISISPWSDSIQHIFHQICSCSIEDLLAQRDLVVLHPSRASGVQRPSGLESLAAFLVHSMNKMTPFIARH